MSERSYQVDSPGGLPNILQSVARRWPLLLIAAVAGAVVGFLGYSAVPPTYQSTAQLQVIKQDTARIQDMRTGYVDDYVATQVDVLRSEKVLIAATKSPLMSKVSDGLTRQWRADDGTVDDMKAYKLLKTNLGVSRSRETAVGLVGNSIVNLSFNGDDPRDTRMVLEAVISVFQQELSRVSQDSNTAKIEQLKSQIARHTTDINDLSNRRVEKEKVRQQLTTEPVEAINQRWMADKAEVFKIKQQLTDIDATLEAIAKVGKDRTERLKLLAILTGAKRAGPDTSVTSLEGQKLMLELRRKSLTETLGPDHSLVKEVDAQLTMVNQEYQRQHPDNPTGEVDELRLHELQQQLRKRSLDQFKKEYETRIDKDAADLKSISPLTVEMNDLSAKLLTMGRQLDEWNSQRSSLEAAQSQGVVVYKAEELNKPHDGLKVGPLILAWLIPGVLLGALSGVGLALLVELKDKSFRSPAEIRERLGVPVIGHLPNIRKEMPREADVSSAYDPVLVAAVRPRSVESESYRGVRTQVIQAAKGADGKPAHQVVQVTSPAPGDGKSTLAANLAISLAQAGKKVVLLDCDFRKPRVHKLFALPKPEVGLASVTNGETDLEHAVRHSDVDGLDLLPCGPRPDNPAELLSGQRFQEVLNELKSRYDFVIVDTPPLLAVSDPRAVAQRVDKVLLVFRISGKVRPLAERAKEYLTDMGASLLGVVVNGGGGKEGEYGYGYGYQYAYDYDYQYAEEYSDDKSKF